MKFHNKFDNAIIEGRTRLLNGVRSKIDLPQYEHYRLSRIMRDLLTTRFLGVIEPIVVRLMELEEDRE